MNIIYAHPHDIIPSTILIDGVSIETLDSFLRASGCNVSYLGFDELLNRIRLTGATSTADIILLEGRDLAVERSSERAITQENIANELRALPEALATSDHRKWKAIPIIGLVYGEAQAQLVNAPLKFSSASSHSDILRDIQEEVAAYRRLLLDELDNLGFLITEDHGRLRVAGPALAPAEPLETSRYYAPNLRARVWTIDRTAYGVQYDVELLEELINNPNLTEAMLQDFFEEHPYLLTQDQFQAIAHPRLLDTINNELYVPDFVLKPIVAARRDSNWQVLDLKLPSVKLIAGKGRYARASHEVMRAIRQLRYYRDYFRNSENRSAVEGVLGAPLQHPKLAVLIGRMPGDDDSIAAIEREQAEMDVAIVTYDEIIERQVRLIGG